MGVACRAGHKGAEVELADPDAATVRCAHQDVAVSVGDQDLVAVVAPLEVADGGPPVVDQLHDGPAIVVTPHNDHPRRITGSCLVQVFVPANDGHLGVWGCKWCWDKQVLLMNVQTRWSCRTMGGRGRARWVKASVLASVSTNQISARPYTRNSANKRTNVLTNHRLFLYVLILLFFSCRFEHTHTRQAF